MKKDTCCEKKPIVGGQAVLEGVMMRAPKAMAIAVRRENGDIVVKREEVVPLSEKHKWMGLPFLRGTVSMIYMFKLGLKTMDDATKMLGILDEEPSKFELWFKKHFGKGADKLFMTLTMILALVLSMGLFVFLPNIPAKALRASGLSLILVNLLSGLIRIAILMSYLYLSAKNKDIRRTFQYHGSEHKTVSCFESDLPLEVKNAQRFTTLHPRCGTSFLLITFIFSILFYSIVDQLVFSISGFDLGVNYIPRILSRILLLPMVAGISYEALRCFAEHENSLTKALRWPGMQLQRLTTKAPDDSMVEVAITSLKAALYGLPEGEKTPEGWVIIKKAQEENASA